MTENCRQHLCAMMTSLWPKTVAKWTDAQWEAITEGAANLPLAEAQVEACCKEHFRQSRFLEPPGLLALLKRAAYPQGELAGISPKVGGKEADIAHDLEVEEFAAEAAEWWRSQSREDLQALIDEISEWPMVGGAFLDRDCRPKTVEQCSAHPFARRAIYAMIQLDNEDRYWHKTHPAPEGAWKDIRMNVLTTPKRRHAHAT